MPVPIVAAVRSPFAEADGVLAGWHPVDLAARVMDAALDAAGLAADAVDLVIAGCAEPVGAQGANAAQASVLAAGWPASIPGQVVDGGPVSGFAALAAALATIESGRAQNVVVVGLNSASVVQPGASALGRLYGRPWGDAPAARYADVGGLVPPITAADRQAVERGIDRAAQDAWGMRSIERRDAATTPAIVEVGARPGESVAVQRDAPIAHDVIRIISLDELEPVFDPDGTTTAAGLAPAADGVSVIVLSTHPGLAALGELVSTSITASDPTDPLGGLVTPPLGDDEICEVAEPSASTALLAIERLNPRDEVNCAGGTIAVGDAAAAEDLRLIIDALHRAGPGQTGIAARTAAGAAGMSRWRRS